MRKLTEANRLFLKASLNKMGINGEIDEYGNVVSIDKIEEPAVEKSFLGFRFITKQKTSKSKTKVVMSLQEVMSKVLGLDYDPNELVEAIAAAMLKAK